MRKEGCCLATTVCPTQITWDQSIMQVLLLIPVIYFYNKCAQTNAVLILLEWLN